MHLPSRLIRPIRPIGPIRQIGLFLLACALAWLAGDSPAWACPNCGDAMASDPAQAGLVRGIFWSILFLLSMPFLIFACLGGYFYWLIRNAQRVASAPAPVHASAVATPATSDSPFMPDASGTEDKLEPVEA